MLDILEAISDPALFEPWFSGPSWNAWRVVLKGAFALPMTATELNVFRSLSERNPPKAPVRELWIVAGRRAGKDSIASVIAAHFAAFTDYRTLLRPGERALIMALAVDRDQARIVLNYTRSYFENIGMLHQLVTRETADGFELANGAEVAIYTNSFRSVRGRTLAAVIFDEVAFWRDDNSAAPDRETYNAVLPGLATLPGTLLVGISSGYRKSGLLWEKYRRHYGRDGDVLVIKAPSLMLNPTLDPTIVERAIEEDPEAAQAEWLGGFRSDISSFVDRAVVEAAVVPGRHELPPIGSAHYTAFVDPSGGSSDAMTLAIAHQEQDHAVFDAVREVRPPFSPESVVKDFADLLRAYRVQRVHGDRYGGEWPRSRFREHGIEYVPATKSKSDLYRELLPLLNSGRVELLDHPRLVAQLCNLERRTARGGRDSIDHPAGGHDDVVNAVAGAAVTLIAIPPMSNWGIFELYRMRSEALDLARSQQPAVPTGNAPRLDPRDFRHF